MSEHTPGFYQLELYRARAALNTCDKASDMKYAYAQECLKAYSEINHAQDEKITTAENMAYHQNKANAIKQWLLNKLRIK